MIKVTDKAGIVISLLHLKITKFGRNSTNRITDLLFYYKFKYIPDLEF